MARALPGLTRASKLQSKAAKAGFDWEEVSPALDKLSEELEELKAGGDGDGFLGLGVAPCPLSTGLDLKRAKAHQLYLLPPAQGF